MQALPSWVLSRAFPSFEAEPFLLKHPLCVMLGASHHHHHLFHTAQYSTQQSPPWSVGAGVRGLAILFFF